MKLQIRALGPTVSCLVRATLFITLITKVSIATEKDLYDFLWLDPDKSVYVLQNKVYSKKNSFYTNFGLLKGLSTDFQDVSGWQFKAGYFFAEEWGVELLYTKISNADDDALKNLGAVTSAVPFVRRINSYYGGVVVWSPFYGKINTFKKIYYFDVMFGIGAAKVNGETNRDDFLNTRSVSTYQEENHTALLWKTEMRFYLTEHLNVNVGLINLNYKAQGARPNSKNKFISNSDAVLSIGWSF